MRDVWRILIALVRTARYRLAVVIPQIMRRWHQLLWTDRVCKGEGCNKYVFVWHRGGYCWLHSRERRVHTVLAILEKTPK